MHDNRFLHEGERLLCTQRSTLAVLVQSMLVGVLEGVIAGAVLDIAMGAAAFFLAVSLAPFLYVTVFVLVLLLVLGMRVRVYRHALFRVTTERMLLSDAMHLFHPPMHTIKWTQYQESEAGHKNFFDAFFFSRPLKIRYGTADAKSESVYPSLYYAEDLKHYLDKVDSLLRAGKTTEIKEFVAKPRGKRDAA